MSGTRSDDDDSFLAELDRLTPDTPGRPADACEAVLSAGGLVVLGDWWCWVGLGVRRLARPLPLSLPATLSWHVSRNPHCLLLPVPSQCTPYQASIFIFRSDLTRCCVCLA